jgi:hypothetical protein
MNKKFLWIAALIAALALIFTGCGGGDEESGGGGEDEISANNWYLATDDDGTKAPNNQIKLDKMDDSDGRTYLRIFFDPPGTDFNKVIIDFTISANGADVCLQSVKDSSGTWGFNPAGLSDGNFIGYLENGPLEFDPAERFTSSWGATGSKLDKSSMYFICIYAVNEDATFTLTGIKFLVSGSEEGGGEEESNPNPAGIDPAGADWYLATTEGGALKAVDNKWIFSSNEGYAYIYFKPDENLNTVKLEFNVNPSVSVIRQAVYVASGTWGWGNGEVSSGTEIDLTGGGTWGAASLDKATMKGVCLKIEGATTFTLTGVTIVTN